MANEELLLRMLEPVVRPDGIAGRGRAPSQPFESQSFEAMLAEAHKQEETSSPQMAQTLNQSAEPARAWCARLGQIDQIENPTLRNLIAANMPQNPTTME